MNSSECELGFTYNLLGMDIYIESCCFLNIEHLKQYYAKHLVEKTKRSPDICIYLAETLEKDRLRYLYRSQPPTHVQNLGAHILLPGERWKKWESPHPITIPYWHKELRNTYHAFHGACVGNPTNNECLFLLGEKGAGKSTVSLRLCKGHKWELLSDENVIIHGRLNLALPLLRPPHSHRQLKSGDILKHVVNYETIPWLSTGEYSKPMGIYVLECFPGIAKPVFQRSASVSESIKLLLKHIIHFGSDNATVSKILLDLAIETNIYKVIYGDYIQLEKISHQLNAMHISEAESENA